MKKTLIALTCGLALALSASTAQALTIGDADPRYLGEIDPAVPSDPGNEVDYINKLISMAPNTIETTSVVSPPGADTFDRSDNTCGNPLELDSCPQATLVGADTGNDPTLTGSVDVTGYTWLYVKYGGDAHVWYVGDLSGVQPVPLNNTGGQGQSHYALYNPTTVQVPDGGATLGLLGLGMLGLGYLRRRKQQ
jgi:hypothetical protein